MCSVLESLYIRHSIAAFYNMVGWYFTKVYCFVVVDCYAYFLILFENLGAHVASGVQGAGQHFLFDSWRFICPHSPRPSQAVTLGSLALPELMSRLVAYMSGVPPDLPWHNISSLRGWIRSHCCFHARQFQNFLLLVDSFRNVFSCFPIFTCDVRFWDI